MLATDGFCTCAWSIEATCIHTHRITTYKINTIASGTRKCICVQSYLIFHVHDARHTMAAASSFKYIHHNIRFHWQRKYFSNRAIQMWIYFVAEYSLGRNKCNRFFFFGKYNNIYPSYVYEMRAESWDLHVLNNFQKIRVDITTEMKTLNIYWLILGKLLFFSY